MSEANDEVIHISRLSHTPRDASHTVRRKRSDISV